MPINLNGFHAWRQPMKDFIMEIVTLHVLHAVETVGMLRNESE